MYYRTSKKLFSIVFGNLETPSIAEHDKCDKCSRRNADREGMTVRQSLVRKTRKNVKTSFVYYTAVFQYWSSGFVCCFLQLATGRKKEEEWEGDEFSLSRVKELVV